MKYLTYVFFFAALAWRSNAHHDNECSRACPPGWTHWRASCYRFYNQPRLNFDESEAYCNQFVHEDNDCKRGHLVAMNSGDENEFIFNWWRTLREPSSATQVVRIGFTDELSEGFWNWSDGSSGIFTRWDNGQPDNAGNAQHCAVMWKTTADRGAWDDESCSAQRPFICEVEANK